MPVATVLTERLGLSVPVIQAPMAGAVARAELAAAVSEAGGLGSLGAAMLAPDDILGAADEIRSRTSRPFNLNLLITGAAAPSDAQVRRVGELLQPFRDELGLPAPDRPPRPPPFTLDDQLAAIVAVAPAVASFAFGLPPAAALERLRERGCLLVGTATTAAEARTLEQAGFDAIVAQGGEAGGHRGTFLGSFESALVGMGALVTRIVDEVSVPVIAAGGIMDGRGVAAALALGAAAAQIGTAFLPCPESGIDDTWRAALAAAEGDDTIVTPVFTGRHARVIANRYSEALAPHAGELAAYPVQAALASDVIRAPDRDFALMFAGQGVGAARSLPAGELVAALAAETSQALARVGA